MKWMDKNGQRYFITPVEIYYYKQITKWLFTLLGTKYLFKKLVIEKFCKCYKTRTEQSIVINIKNNDRCEY
jgi:hypothetical protein